ncbi:hypothetical protein ACFQZE_19980 [Paenibacillus sp. GCM10027627]
MALVLVMSFVLTVSASAAPAYQYPNGYTLTGGGNLTVTGTSFRAAYPGDNDVLLYRHTSQGVQLYNAASYLNTGGGTFSHTYTGLPQGTYYLFFPGQPWRISNVQFQFH